MHVQAWLYSKKQYLLSISHVKPFLSTLLHLVGQMAHHCLLYFPHSHIAGQGILYFFLRYQKMMKWSEYHFPLKEIREKPVRVCALPHDLDSIPVNDLPIQM